jgi:hypothetical protein
LREVGYNFSLPQIVNKEEETNGPKDKSQAKDKKSIGVFRKVSVGDPFELFIEINENEWGGEHCKTIDGKKEKYHN